MRLSPAVWIRAKTGAKKPLVNSVGAGPIVVIPPYSWGSTQSRLIDMLQKGHPGTDGKPRVTLNKESLDRIVTWIDMNVPYYPSHVTFYGSNTAGRSPLNHKDLLQLGRLVLNSPGGKKYGWNRVNEYTCGQIARIMSTHGSPVNFTRPEMSLCLTGCKHKNGTAYKKALALIQKGAENLKTNPRLDMEGFKPGAADQARLDFLEKRRQVELLNRRAIIEGKKRYDEVTPR